MPEKTSKRKPWLLILVAGVIIAAGALWIAVSQAKKRFEPYIRAQAISWLEKRFNADVRLASLNIHIPAVSPLHLWFTKGRGTLARVEGHGLQLHQRAAADYPPVIAIQDFSFSIDLGAVFDPSKSIDTVTLTGAVITIPPKGERAPVPPAPPGSNAPNVFIREVVLSNARLVILPAKQGKLPLDFDIASLTLHSIAKDQPMQYQAVLTNPKPVGLIHSSGSFGPWDTTDPGDTPLSGHYAFDHADLSIFSAIAGMLQSTGDFTGSLSAVNAKGVATIPDFRLKSAGNPVPLSTSFEVLVDGTNGNTVLQPVHATLGGTRFTTSGAVLKKEGDRPRSVSLDVSMPSGNLQDILRLAMKGTPFMEGTLALKSKILVPPLDATVKEKLILAGQFRISHERFLRDAVQDKIDSLSRRGQGRPKNEAISDVLSDMTGAFHLEDQKITFQSLTFATKGALVNLVGDYDLGKDNLDFHGSLSLDAKVSETMTGWKRWALKPVDPFFAKNGAGTYLRIKIVGNSKSPDFGLDHGKPDSEPPKPSPPPAKSGPPVASSSR